MDSTSSNRPVKFPFLFRSTGTSSVAAASLLICLNCLPALQAQMLDSQAEFQAQSRPYIETLPSGEKALQWSGQTGQTYFFQTSKDLRIWTWLPTIQSGVTAPMSNLVSSTSPGNFFRLVRTTLPRPPGITVGDWDADGDTLANWTELTTYGSNPLLADTHFDGMPDGWEVIYSLNLTQNDANLDPDSDNYNNVEEYQNNSHPQSYNYRADLDSDSMPDAWEISNGLNTSINDSALDPDGDGLTNLQEFILRTNPKDADTDDDNLPDEWEFTYHLNPQSN
jgi:hypothetical protein